MFPVRFSQGTKSRTEKALIYKGFSSIVPYVPRVPCHFLFLYTREIYILCYLAIYKGYIFAGNNREQGTEKVKKVTDHRALTQRNSAVNFSKCKRNSLANLLSLLFLCACLGRKITFRVFLHTIRTPLS